MSQCIPICGGGRKYNKLHDDGADPLIPLPISGCCGSTFGVRINGLRRHKLVSEQRQKASQRLLEISSKLAKTSANSPAYKPLQYEFDMLSKSLCQPPDLSEALDYRDSVIPNCDDTSNSILSFCASEKQIAEENVDIAVQLRLIDFLLIMFAVLTAANWDLIKTYQNGGEMRDSSDFFVLGSLGNMPPHSITSERITFEIRLAIFLFLFMVVSHILLKLYHTRLHDKLLEPEDYTLYVSGLPKQTTTDAIERQEELVKAAFQPYGEIVNITVARKIDTILADMRQLEQLEAQARQKSAIYYQMLPASGEPDQRTKAAMARQKVLVDTATKAAAAFQEKQLSRKAIQEMDAKGAYPSSGDAFVTFARVTEASDLPKVLMIAGKECKVSQAPSPRNINWAQLHASKAAKVNGFIVSNLASSLLLVACLSAILSCTFAQTRLNVELCGPGLMDPVLCFAANQLIGIVPGVAFGVIFGVLPSFVSAFERHKKVSAQVQALAVRIVFFQLANTLLTPSIFYFFLTDWQVSAEWYVYATGPCVMGLLIGLVILQFLMGAIALLFTLPQLFVSAVLYFKCLGVPHCYAWMERTCPCLAAFLSIIPVLGKFPLDQMAANEYFVFENSFYLGVRTGEIAVPLISTMAFGVAFPMLYPIAFVATLIGVLQDRWNFLRRMKPLAPMSGVPLSEAVTGTLFPILLILRFGLMLVLFENKLDSSPHTQIYLKRLATAGIGCSAIFLLFAGVFSRRLKLKLPIPKPGEFVSAMSRIVNRKAVQKMKEKDALGKVSGAVLTPSEQSAPVWPTYSKFVALRVEFGDDKADYMYLPKLPASAEVLKMGTIGDSIFKSSLSKILPDV